MSLEPVNSSTIKAVSTATSSLSAAAIEPAQLAIAEANAVSSSSSSYVGGGKRKASEITTPSESFALVGGGKSSSSSSKETDEASSSLSAAGGGGAAGGAKRLRPSEVKFSEMARVRFVEECADGNIYSEIDVKTCFDDRSGDMIDGCMTRAPGRGIYDRDVLTPQVRLEQKLLSKNVSFLDLLNSVAKDEQLAMGSLFASPQQEYYAIHNEMGGHFYLAAQLGLIPNHYTKHLSTLVADALIEVLQEQDTLDTTSKVKVLSELKPLLFDKMQTMRDMMLTKDALADIISFIDSAQSKPKKELKWAYLKQAVATHSSEAGAVDYSKVADDLAKVLSEIPHSYVKLSNAKKGHDLRLPISVVDAREFPDLLAAFHSGEWKEEEEKVIRLHEIKEEFAPGILSAIDSFMQNPITNFYFFAARSFNSD